MASLELLGVECNTLAMRFWSNGTPLYIHRLVGNGSFDGPMFASVDEGDERTVISPIGGKGASGPLSYITMGPFDLDTVGVLAKASAALAEAKVPIFVISTYRYDHILVPCDRKDEAISALLATGFTREDRDDSYQERKG